MSVLENLVATVRADIDLLQLRDQQGDVFAMSRPVDFLFFCQRSHRRRPPSLASCRIINTQRPASPMPKMNSGAWRH